MDQGQLNWPGDYQSVSQVHIFDNQHVPGPVITCPRSIFLIINMSLGQTFLVLGPSILLEEWPWDNQNVSQVHIYDNKYVPGPVIYCPWSIIVAWRMSPGLSNCPRSIFLIINMSLGQIFFVPGPSLLLEEWPWDYQTVSQVHIFDDHYVPGPVICCPWSIIIV